MFKGKVDWFRELGSFGELSSAIDAMTRIPRPDFDLVKIAGCVGGLDQEAELGHIWISPLTHTPLPPKSGIAAKRSST